MRKIFLLIIFSVFLVFLLVKTKKVNNSTSVPKTIDKIILALDWTPNTNHTGIYVADKKGYFKDEGLEVTILPFSVNASPDMLINAGKADVGISSAEAVVTDAAIGAPVISIAAIIQHNTSALITLADSGILRPKDLSGKNYGGFGAPFEEAVISQIIKNDGGKGEFKNITLDTEALKALESKRIDFVWVYQGWESIAAKREGYNIKEFPITSYGIPDYYTPTFITNRKTIDQKSELLRRFMKAITYGYEFARENPKPAAQILIESVPKGTFPDEELVYQSQEYLSFRYADKGRKWGIQDSYIWQEYPQFMLDTGSIKDTQGNIVKKLDFNSLYTNDLLPK